MSHISDVIQKKIKVNEYNSKHQKKPTNGITFRKELHLPIIDITDDQITNNKDLDKIIQIRYLEPKTIEIIIPEREEEIIYLNLQREILVKQINLNIDNWRENLTFKGLDKLKNLHSLILRHNYLGPLNFLDNIVNLEYLNLDCCTIERPNIIPKLTKLRGLDINFVTNRRSDEYIDELVKMISSFKELELLSIPEEYIPWTPFNLPKLTYLEITSEEFDKPEIIGSLEFKRYPKNLRYISLKEQRYQSLEGIEYLSQLEEADFESNSLSTDDLSLLLTLKKSNELKDLKLINLTHNNIYWTDIRAGSIAWKLKYEQGLDIIAENLEINPPKATDFFEIFLDNFDPKGELTDKDRTELYNKIYPILELTKSNLELIDFYDKGFTSKKAFEFKQNAIKIDKVERLRKELKFYQLDMGQFKTFMPNTQEIKLVETEAEAWGILIMPNLKHYEEGKNKANRIRTEIIQEFTQYKIGYNLFLMTLFHKEATKHIDQFDQVMYEGVDGLPHWEEGNIPYRNIKGNAYKRFMQTRIDSKRIVSTIQEYRELQKMVGNTLIHGDWKDDNLVNGHLVDYAMVGIGFEVDEIAYYLSDCKFKLGLEDFHRLIDYYVFMRSTHDSEFTTRVDNGYRQTIYQLAEPAFLSQLVLRHSVMNKRDMMDDSKFKQRQYYQNKINEVLRDGILR